MPRHPTSGQRSHRRSALLRARMSPEMKARIEAAAAADGVSVTRWLETVVAAAAPPLLDDADTVPPAAKPKAGRRPARPPAGQAALDEGQEARLAS